ncbi:MAG: hypothetical protein OFPII_25710 [Osedax symbiont Rs1]|nr:MAG: hypothetical protein OFPII_25710 [Osedax symbiont Rs1]
MIKTYINDLVGLSRGYKATGLFFFINFVLIGVVGSHLAISQIYWLGSVSLILYSSYLVFVGNYRFKKRHLSFFLFPIYIVCSSVFFTEGLELKIIAVKDYIIPSLSFFILSSCLFKNISERSIYIQFRAIAIIQFPFVLWQYYFTARSNITARELDWDVISGTFGFNPEGGGGNSPTFVAFQFLVLTMILKKLRLSGFNRLDFITIVTILITVAIAEAKVLALLAVFVLISVSKATDLFNVKFITSSLIILLLTLFGGVLSYQNKSFSGEDSGLTTNQYLTKLADDYLDTEVINFETGEVGRIDAVRLWISDVYYAGDNANTLLGHGLTSSKYSNNHITEAVSYGTYINFASNQLTIYLWDVGLVGVLLCVFFLMRFIFSSFFNIRETSDDLQILAAGSRFIALCLLVYPVYSNVFHSSSAAQALLLIGFILFNNSILFRRVQ